MYQDGQRVLIKSHGDVFLVENNVVTVNFKGNDEISLVGKIGVIEGYDPTDYAPTEDVKPVAWIPVFVENYFAYLLPDEVEIIN